MNLLDRIIRFNMFRKKLFHLDMKKDLLTLRFLCQCNVKKES